MHLREGEFSQAHTDFFEAFKNYDESGSPRCSSFIVHVCVKMIVLLHFFFQQAIGVFEVFSSG